jgi:hypothetical protein
VLVTRQTTTPSQFLLAGGAVTWVVPVAVVRYRKPKYGIWSPTPASGNMHVAPAARHFLIGTRTLCWEMGHWPADLPPPPPDRQWKKWWCSRIHNSSEDFLPKQHVDKHSFEDMLEMFAHASMQLGSIASGAQH